MNLYLQWKCQIFDYSVSVIEKGFIAETGGGFFKGDIHFGFNISRAFQIKKWIGLKCI
ncbi:DUF5777 family beta-barrel protein [Arenibacter palladensis]|uniref:DUF5777 family beta-barrel protein n=1 Tax=Arenibacter palladensis TaxID=237373 RepID=UPI002FD06D41